MKMIPIACSHDKNDIIRELRTANIIPRTTHCYYYYVVVVIVVVAIIIVAMIRIRFIFAFFYPIRFQNSLRSNMHDTSPY